MVASGLAVLALSLLCRGQDPFQDLDRKKEERKPAEPGGESGGFFGENFTFKKEIYSQFSYSTEEPEPGEPFIENVYSRQSLGLEFLKKFSTPTSTVGSFDFQGRVVRRDHFVETINDTEGMDRPGWFFEYHNLYGDLYNVFDFFLSNAGRTENLGRFNLRAGHFYLPFGLNLQTDTHGTLLQLSNDRNFGFERDWYAGFWGSIESWFNYDLYYLAGSGYPLSFRGQSGLLGLRLSLPGQLRTEEGFEGGLSFLRGERLDKMAVGRSATVAGEARDGRIVDTLRVGLDLRYTLPLPSGSVILTAEVSGGWDESDAVVTQLYQAEYLAERRQWGLSVQYRRFWQDPLPSPVDASIITELAWYFRNDLTGSFLHSIRLNVERQLERQMGSQATVVTIQYYFYW